MCGQGRRSRSPSCHYPRSAVSTGPLLIGSHLAYVVHQCCHRHTRASGSEMARGAPTVEGGSGDVEMGPGETAGELAQEGGGVQPTAPADPVVLVEVGHLG